MGKMNPKSPGPSQVHISFNAIDSGLSEETLQFRLVHFWEARNPTKGGLLIGLELLMIDEKEKVTKQTVMERALTEQLKERQEMERKLQKLAKTMDYLERAKREEAAPLIEAAYQRRLLEEREFYEREQQREVQLSRERHESDLKKKSRLSRMLEFKEIFQEQMISRRQAEFDRIRAQREEHISQIIRARKQERDIKRKQIYYLTTDRKLSDGKY